LFSLCFEGTRGAALLVMNFNVFGLHVEYYPVSCRYSLPAQHIWSVKNYICV